MMGSLLCFAAITIIRFVLGLFVQTFAIMYNFCSKFEIRSGPVEQMRRLGKLFSEEYAADLDKVWRK